MSRPQARKRSRSIVQAIAQRVPEVSSHIELTSSNSDTDSSGRNVLLSYKNEKLRSADNLLDLLQVSNSTDTFVEKRTSHYNYPLSKNESDLLWRNYLLSFEYNLLVSEESEDAIFNNHIAKYLNFQNDLILKHANNDLTLQRIDLLLSSIYNLNSKYQTITNDTKEFQQQSNELIEQYNELTQFHQVLSQNLSHFENLNEINHFLNKPGLNKIIRSSKFLKVLKNLDNSLKFVNENPDFRDIESYRIILQSSLTKALTLIKNYINNTLNNTYNTISGKLNQLSDATSITSNALLYTKFEQSSLDINNLILILYEKQVIYHGEYEGLVSDVYGTYFNSRSRLLISTIRNNINSSILLNKPLIQFFQDNLSFFISLINDEYELFYKFFNEYRLLKLQEESNKLSITDKSLDFKENLSSLSLVEDVDYFHDPMFNFFDYLSFGSDDFFQWIEESVLESLYDVMRNKILKETDINTLCQLIILLQKYYEDYTQEDFENFLDTEQDFLKFRINFAKLFNPILTDIQSRLIFRVQVFIEENITKYKPKLDDFKLSNKKSNAGESSENNEEQDKYYEGWYPTLKTSITLLSQIHLLVNSAIFDDLAHNIVHLCILSLTQAYEFSLKFSGAKDSKLFLIKNLLILKKNVENFDIDFTSYNDVDFDFSGITELFNKFRTGTVWPGNGGIIQIAKDSVPKIVNNMYDAKIELQLKLRNTVHSFIETVVEDITQPLLSHRSDKDLNQKIVSIMAEFKSNIRSEFDNLKDLLVIYIDDALVINYLLDGIKELLIQNYDLFYSSVVSNIETDASVSKESLNDLIESDVLINYLGELTNELFNVGGDDNSDIDVGLVQDLSDIEPIGEDLEAMSQ